MTWDYWISLFTGTHCVARGLRPNTIAAYRKTLDQFHAFATFQLEDKAPNEITAADVLSYVEHLRTDRGNGPSAVNRHVTILKSFYRAIVTMGHLDPHANPMAWFPKIKASPRKLPEVLSEQEMRKLLDSPPSDTVIGLRDRAILALLYGTGIRATECAALRDKDVDLDQGTVTVVGKGGHERTLPLNAEVVSALKRYQQQRGLMLPQAAFFQSRSKKAMSRGAIYERVRTHAQRCKINKRMSPHKVRHTFATHLVKAGVNLVTIRDLLGHRCITSTQIYLHVTAEDLKEAAKRHPIERLAPTLEDLLPDVKLVFQPPPRRRARTG